MEQILSGNDRIMLDKCIAEAEKRTNTQIVLAVIKRSDTYAELPWKAFALGVSITGLAIFIQDIFFHSWISQTTALITVASMLAAGAALALLTIFAPGFARLFLPVHRAETEVRQYAESLFLSRELFATKGRSGIILLVSLFERQVILLPDTGLGSRLAKEAMQDIIAPVTSLLAQNEIREAMEAGLDRLCIALGSDTCGGQTSGENELPNEIIEEKGV
jgi:putative membrane protein